MRGSVLNRIVGAVGIGAVALLGLGVALNAQPQRGQQQQQEKKDKKQQEADKRAKDKQAKEQQAKEQQQARVAQQQQDKKDKEQQAADKRAQQAKDKQARDKQAKEQQQARVAQQQQARAAQQQQQTARDQQLQQTRVAQQARSFQRLAEPDQQRLITQQRQRLAQYGDYLGQRQRAAEDRAVQLQRANRPAQYSVQLQYVAGLDQLQLRLQSQRDYNYGSDPYFYTAPTYRYSRGGQYYRTNQYGVDLLRQAVDYGYDQGLRAGMADRQDRWAGNYRNAYAYQDANYGYTGFYVDRGDYNYYFREGFRRGYQDGYGGRYRYGTYVSGSGTILGAIAATILNFQSIR